MDPQSAYRLANPVKSLVCAFAVLAVLASPMMLTACCVEQSVAIDTRLRFLIGLLLIPVLSHMTAIILIWSVRPPRAATAPTARRRFGKALPLAVTGAAILAVLVRWTWAVRWEGVFVLVAGVISVSLVGILTLFFVLANLALKGMMPLVLAAELLPRRFRERRIHRDTCAMTKDEACAAAADLLRHSRVFRVERVPNEQTVLPEGAPADVATLLREYRDIRLTETNGALLQREAVAWVTLHEHRCLRLAPQDHCGPIVAFDEDDHSEVFQEDGMIRTGFPWGCGWPSVSHYLVYEARISPTPVDSAGRP